MALAVVPNPGKFFGQQVIIFQRLRSWDIAGAEKVDAAATAATALPLSKARRFRVIGFSSDHLSVVVYYGTLPWADL